MKAGGPINERITKHNENAGDVSRYVVACVGTKMCRYMDASGDWTTNENDAWQMPKSDATTAMQLLDPKLFPYCRLVKVIEGNGERQFPPGMLPTIMGL